MPREQHVDISETQSTPIRGNPDQVRLNAGYKEIPFDFPAFMYITRHVGDGEQGLLGWSMDLEVLARAKITLKISKNGPTDILVDGVRVHRIPRAG